MRHINCIRKLEPFLATILILSLPTSMDLGNLNQHALRLEGQVMDYLPPLGSAAGNISPPQIDQAATAVMMPAKPD